MNGLQGFRISPQQASLYPHLNGGSRHPFGCQLQWAVTPPVDADTLTQRLQALAGGS